MEKDQKQFVHITVNLYFEVKDCEIYGGDGSIGYAEHKFEGDFYSVNLTDEYIDTTIEFMAAMLKVPKENIRLISKTEYEEKTEEKIEDDSE